MMAPFKPMQLHELRDLGALPWPQSQMALAGDFPAWIRALFTG